MTKAEFEDLEQYMSMCMDGSDDREHVYRVLYAALDIASMETEVDYDVLIAACLLHDIGKKEQFANPARKHAQVGAEKAYQYLQNRNWVEKRAAHVRDCINTHSIGLNKQPESLEARILFDADKLDVTGALGTARILRVSNSEPLYLVRGDGTVSDGGSEDRENTFLWECKHDLVQVYEQFYTVRGKELAAGRRKAAEDFYQSFLKEAQAVRNTGRKILSNLEVQE